ncbi:hypothetical protein [Rhodomicrobium sp.]|uniref:hypothetical protein n=1 Tax=Rhodomicrobium sp. TaxID=2720632 RepID=UPI0039E4B63E
MRPVPPFRRDVLGQVAGLLWRDPRLAVPAPRRLTLSCLQPERRVKAVAQPNTVLVVPILF